MEKLNGSTTLAPINRFIDGCDRRAHTIIELVSLILSKIIEANILNLQSTKVVPLHLFVKFQSSYEPNLSISSYLDRIYRYSKCSDSCFILMLVYVDRMIEKQSLVLSNLNVHRILITSMMLAAKYHDDLFYNNAYFSKLGGLSVAELNNLELDMLHILDYELFVSQKLFEKYYVQLRNYTSVLSTENVSGVQNSNGLAGTGGCNNAFQFSSHYYHQHQSRHETVRSDQIAFGNSKSGCDICKQWFGSGKGASTLTHHLPCCKNLFVDNIHQVSTFPDSMQSMEEISPCLVYQSLCTFDSTCLVLPNKVFSNHLRLNNVHYVNDNANGCTAAASHFPEHRFGVSDNLYYKNNVVQSAKKRSFDFAQLISSSSKVANGTAWNSENQGLLKFSEDVIKLKISKYDKFQCYD